MPEDRIATGGSARVSESTTALAAIAVSCSGPSLVHVNPVNAITGSRSVDNKLAELGKALHLRRREPIAQIVLSGALPQILVGLRQSLGVARLALVVAAQVNAYAGLGFLISQVAQSCGTT